MPTQNGGHSFGYIDDSDQTLQLAKAAMVEGSHAARMWPKDCMSPKSFYDMMMRGKQKETTSRWPFDTDPAEVLGILGGQPLNEQDAWTVRRLAHANEKPGVWTPQRSRYEWSEDGTRKVVLDPDGGMHYPHPYLVEDDGIADVGETFHEVVRRIGGNPSFAKWSGDWEILIAIMEHHGADVSGQDECKLPAE